MSFGWDEKQVKKSKKPKKRKKDPKTLGDCLAGDVVRLVKESRVAEVGAVYPGVVFIRFPEDKPRQGPHPYHESDPIELMKEFDPGRVDVLRKVLGECYCGKPVCSQCTSL